MHRPRPTGIHPEDRFTQPVENRFSYDNGFAESLKIRAVQGVGWSAGTRITSDCIRFGVMVFLARLLFPRDFGLLGIAMTVTSFAQVFQGGWIGTAIIQRKNLTETQLSSAVWLTGAFGAALTLLLILCSPWAGAFYNNPQIVRILIFLSCTMLLEGFAQVPHALIRRRLDYSRLFLIEVGAAIISGGVGILLACLGFGVWSLVAKILSNDVIRTGLLWSFTRWWPKFGFSYNAVKPLFAVALPLLGFVIVNFFAANMDYLIIGKFLGATALGFYTLGYKIMLLPLEHISRAAANVALPAFSSMQEDKARVGKLYLKIARYISFVTFPVMSGLAIIAPEAIRVALGEKWLPTAAIIRILAVVGALSSIQATTGTIFISQGRSDLELKWSLLGTSCYVIGFFAGLPWGIQGVALGYAVAFVSTSPICFFLALRLINLRLKNLGVALAPAAIGSAVMVLFLVLVRSFGIMDTVHISVRLITLVVIGGVTYVMFNVACRKNFLGEIIEMVKMAICHGGRI